MVQWKIKLATQIQEWHKYIEGYPNSKATIDFETRSACNLRMQGAYPYSKDPTTEVMCMAYLLPDTEEVKCWHKAHPQYNIDESPEPHDLFAFILAGGLIEAHNVFFERTIWTHLRQFWPEVNPEQWRCSASRASAASLPRDLEGACNAMRLPIEKDMVGNKLMKKMCKPRKPRKAEISEWKEEHINTHIPLMWHEEEEDLKRLWEYCTNDVLAEVALSNAIPELDPIELEIWQMDQDINWRGTKFDLDMVNAALELADKWRKRLNTELEQITGIYSATQRAAVKTWLAYNEGLDLPNTTAVTLEWQIANGNLSNRAKRICEITIDVNRTSTSKYKAILNRADLKDWRIRDMFMYHGAGTGRWAGKGVQVQNLPARDLIVKDFSEAAEVIKSKYMDWCIALYGDIMKLLSHSLRGTIVPTEGRDFMIADYSAIEARIVLWLANAISALKVFERGEDIYCDMATSIYGYEVVKGIHNKQRQFGKQAILGLGYGMGFLTFLLTCRRYGIHFTKEDCIRIMGVTRLAEYENRIREHLCIGTINKNAAEKRQARKVIKRLIEAREAPLDIIHELALMKYVVDIYRAKYPEVKQLWQDQEIAAIKALKNRKNEAIIECGKVSWHMDKDWLCCRLPSNRLMRYKDPAIKISETSWGEKKPALTYMCMSSVMHKWCRTITYGGKLVENVTQAIARDIMAWAMLKLHKDGTYDTIMSVHDEIISEVDENKGSIDEFETLISTIPFWAKGCPITAEAERVNRYKK